MKNGDATPAVFGPTVVLYTASDPSIPAIVVAFADIVEEEIDAA